MRFVENFTTDIIGQRHFGGGDQAITVVAQGRDHIGIAAIAQQFAAHRPELFHLEFRHLPGAEKGAFTGKDRRLHLGIAEMIRMKIKHEIAQRPFQPRQPRLQIDEARTGDFRRALEIHQPQRLAQLEMLFGGIHRGP